MAIIASSSKTDEFPASCLLSAPGVAMIIMEGAKEAPLHAKCPLSPTQISSLRSGISC